MSDRKFASIEVQVMGDWHGDVAERIADFLRREYDKSTVAVFGPNPMFRAGTEVRAIVEVDAGTRNKRRMEALLSRGGPD